MKPKVYIDGKEGTTGLQIYERLSARHDIELLLIDEEKRKDPGERKKLLNMADLSFLCLPDAAAVEAVQMVENPSVKIIDASTAHRTAPDWVYGFPELSAAQRNAICNSKRVANPGCHATGLISVVYPLIAAGVLGESEMLSCFSLTGYSGGGKKMIAQYEDPRREKQLSTPALYAVGQSHKHLAEMQKICKLIHAPVFSPVVDDYYKGMATTVPFHMAQLRGISTPEQLRQIYVNHYENAKPVSGKAVVRVAEESSGSIYAGAASGRDSLCILVSGNAERVTVTALFDNLGKGASGAAVQNMNLMLGFDETAGLNLD